jgi:hypothetical protein
MLKWASRIMEKATMEILAKHGWPFLNDIMLDTCLICSELLIERISIFKSLAKQFGIHLILAKQEKIAFNSWAMWQK